MLLGGGDFLEVKTVTIKEAELFPSMVLFNPPCNLIEHPLKQLFMKLMKWILENFGAILLFQAVYHFYGLRPALAASLTYVAAEIIYLKIKNRKLTSFMKFSYALVIVFSLVDLYLKPLLRSSRNNKREQVLREPRTKHSFSNF